MMSFRKKDVYLPQNCNDKMITAKDLYDILENKIANETQKSLIRSNFPPQIADRMCNAIDCKEKAEHFKRFLIEWEEWLVNKKHRLYPVFQLHTIALCHVLFL